MFCAEGTLILNFYLYNEAIGMPWNQLTTRFWPEVKLWLFDQRKLSSLLLSHTLRNFI